jgi:hypothetical protein
LKGKQKRRANWISRGVCLGLRHLPNRANEPGLSQNRGKLYTNIDPRSTQYSKPLKNFPFLGGVLFNATRGVAAEMSKT